MIAIISDSTCDLPQDLIEQYGITIIPQVVTWGDRQYRDRIDLQPVEFYERMVKDPQQPHSSQPAPGAFSTVYQQAIEQGADALLVLTVSAAMSGTYQVAKAAAEGLPVPVEVVDSKGPTMSLGWQVLAAARARDAGLSLNDILERVSQVRSRLVQLVGMDSLAYLQRGGRIGGAVKWVGTHLKIKPLVSINHQTGLVEPEALARTHAGLVDLMYKKFFERFKGLKDLRVAVLHGNVREEAVELAARIQAEFNPLELLVNITGPVLGINTGPGALALCGYAED